MSFLRYPELPELPWELYDDPQVRQYHDYLRAWWSGVVNELEIRDKGTFFGTANVSAWVLTSVSVARTFNPTSGTDAYTATRLATLLSDLQKKGIIS